MARRTAPRAEPITAEPPDAPATDELVDMDLMDTGFTHAGLDLYRETGDMATLADAAFQDWSWQIYRLSTAEERTRDRTKSPRVWQGKHVGPLELGEIQHAYGGGMFEIWGYFDKHLRTRIRVEVAGPRKNYDAPPPFAAPPPAPTAPAAPPVLTNDNLMMRKILHYQRRQLEEVKRSMEALRAPRPEGENGLAGIAAVLKLADELAERRTPHPETHVLDQVVDAFKSGLQLRGEIEGGPPKSTTEVVIEKALPALERILGGVLTAQARRARPAPPPGTPAPVPGAVQSQATVVPDTAEPVVELDMDQARTLTALDGLARAITTKRDPQDFAESLHDILTPEQVTMLALGTDEAVTAQLREAAGGRYPILAHETAAGYIGQVLAALRHGPEDEDDEPDDADEGEGEDAPA